MDATLNPSAVHRDEPIHDLATKAGTYQMIQTTLGEYLAHLDLFDPTTKNGSWDASILNVPFQRTAIPIKQNPIKRRMLRDMLRGGTLPPTVLVQRPGERPLVVDGLQRTHVSAVGVNALVRRAHGEKAEDFIEDEIAAMEILGQSPLSLDELLKRPFVFQQWSDLEPEELVRLFIVLNAGQQKVSPRHLLEVMGAHIRSMFDSWNLPLLTDRQERENPKRRGKRLPEEEQKIPGITHFRYEFLLDGLCAYVARDPHVKTTKLLQDAGDNVKLTIEEKSIDERITEIGSEVCKADFVWACKDLNAAIKSSYANDPKWVSAVQNNDNFFIPLMAALGDARNNEQTKLALEDRKYKLLEIVKDNEGDPLSLTGDNSQSLSGIQGRINSNIGRRQRAIVYGAFRRYFRVGTEDISYPIDWRHASLD